MPISRSGPIRVRVETREINPERYKKFLKSVKELKNSFVDVGVYRGTSHPITQKSMLAIFTHNEFGAPQASIPERSTLRHIADTKVDVYGRFLEGMVDGVISGRIKNVQSKFTELGLWIKGDVREYIVNIRQPRNADSTIARKGFDNPLIETGHLGRAVLHQIFINSKPVGPTVV